LKSPQRGRFIAVSILTWLLLNALSFVTLTPAHLILGLFYRPPAGTDFAPVHLGFFLLIFLPLINAVFVVLLGWLVIALIRRFRSGRQ
jgi:hypothetical protein